MNDLQDIITANNHAFLVGLVKKQAAKLDAIDAVAADLEERGASIEAKGSNGSIYSTRTEGRGIGYRESARLIRSALNAQEATK